MRILYVLSTYLPLSGGCQDAIDQLAPFLQDSGHEVFVLSRRWPDNTPSREQINNVEVYRVETAVTDPELHEMARNVREVVDEIKPDIIHAVGLRRPLPFFALLAARYLQVPVMMTIAGWDVPDPSDAATGKIWHSGKQLVPQALRQADSLNAVSADLARLYQLHSEEGKRIDVLHVGIDTEKFASAEPYAWREPYVLSLRRLENSKRVDVVIRAFAEPELASRTVHLLIAGDGLAKASLVQLVSTLNLASRVHFLGEVDIETSAKLLRGSSAMVIASLAEGGGLVNIEAQAAGTPIVASSVGGIEEYLGGADGAHYLEDARPATIAHAIVRCLDDTDLRARITQHGKLNSMKFDTKALAAEWLGRYEDLLALGATRAYRPWSLLTDSLWRTFSSQSWELTSQRPLDNSGSHTALVRGSGVERWWHMRQAIFGIRTWTMEDRDIFSQLRSQLGEAAFTRLLEEAADWGQVETSDLRMAAEGML